MKKGEFFTIRNMRTQMDSNKWLILLAIGIGTFMSALDGSVVNTILPVLNKVFQSDIAAIEWVIVIYLLVVSGLLLTFGRLGDLRGNRQVYLWGFVIFIVGSGLCGMAPSALILVICRGLQALGAAMLFSNSPAILTKAFPAQQRGQALGIQATMTYLGLTVGPSLGGWLTSAFSWRTVFYINVPVGLLGLYLSWRFVPRDEVARTERFDVTGAILFMAGLVALLLGLDQGAAWGWTSAPILALLGLAVVLLAAFVWVELHQSSPMLDLTLFRAWPFSASVLSALANYIGLYALLFLLPFYLINGRGLSPAQAGLLLSAQPIVMAIAAPISGTLSDRVGARWLSTLGMLILAGGLFFLSTLVADTPLGWVAAGLAICGLGTGIFISPNSSALMGSAPRSRQGIASGVLATARNVGQVLGIGMAGAILSSMAAAQGSGALFGAIHVGMIAAAGVCVAAAVVSAFR